MIYKLDNVIQTLRYMHIISNIYKFLILSIDIILNSQVSCTVCAGALLGMIGSELARLRALKAPHDLLCYVLLHPMISLTISIIIIIIIINNMIYEFIIVLVLMLWIMSYHVMLCHVTSYYIILCYVILYYIMLYYIHIYWLYQCISVYTTLYYIVMRCALLYSYLV